MHSRITILHCPSITLWLERVRDDDEPLTLLADYLTPKLSCKSSSCSPCGGIQVIPRRQALPQLILLLRMWVSHVNGGCWKRRAGQRKSIFVLTLRQYDASVGMTRNNGRRVLLVFSRQREDKGVRSNRHASDYSLLWSTRDTMEPFLDFGAPLSINAPAGISNLSGGGTLYASSMARHERRPVYNDKVRPRRSLAGLRIPSHFYCGR
ncbi:hypothetical protein DFH07DRAFT_815990 [Mycena maculata]|uniref:Uncharacterized protein n=1 Tax=Mycena maculata TaxID=230809 RepID=A0AAD7JE55_9AGAR|nr:hypothetical protein DFH07DRAFT_815990 [Mycena maculata]